MGKTHEDIGMRRWSGIIQGPKEMLRLGKQKDELVLVKKRRLEK